MYMLMKMTLLLIMMSILMMTTCSIISKKSSMDKEKLSPFECGFDPNKSLRMPFSTQFFLISVLFLIFDIEIMIIVPMVMTMKSSSLSTWTMTTMMFMTILISGLTHEWKTGVLEWAS